MEALKKNHFDLFGLNRGFALDPEALEKAYLALQRVVHPDRFAHAGDTQRRLALQMTAQVNEAHQTLMDPARRAAYLCQLEGQDVGLESNTAMPAAFLMLQMSWREALDEALVEEAVPAREAGLAKLRAEAQAKTVELQMQLHQALDEEKNFVQAAGLTRQLVFVDKFLHDLSHRG